MKRPSASHSHLIAALLLLGCPDRFEPGDGSGIATADGGSTTSEPATSSGATTDVSASSVADSLPPPPETDGTDPTDDSGATSVGGDCAEGELQCAGGTEPFLLLCEGGGWTRVSQSHPSAAGDCDGVCEDETNGVFLADDCIDDACVCDRACPKAAEWEDGFCVDAESFMRCQAGEWDSFTCDFACQAVCGGAAGLCEPGYAVSNDTYYDTCVCDYSGCGSCDGACGLKDGVPDGSGVCYCDPSCEVEGDCCYDYFEVCGGKAVGPGRETDVRAWPVSTARPRTATEEVWPSLRAYPRIPDALAQSLHTGEPLAVLSGLRDAFDVAEWPNPRQWDRFGAIAIGEEPAFVSLEEGALGPLDGVSLGCVGGFVEAVRLLAAPQLQLGTVLNRAPNCPARTPEVARACEDDAHTGLHVLANLRDRHLRRWSLRVVELDDAERLQQVFAASADPYYVSASHRQRGTGQHRYHHMMVLVVDDDGPVIFDATGRRGVALRRVSWRRLSRYFGVILSEGTRFPYAHGSAKLAVLHSGH